MKNESVRLSPSHETYLEELKNSGKINMFNAVPYLMAEFDLSRAQGKSILLQWIEKNRN